MTITDEAIAAAREAGQKIGPCAVAARYLKADRQIEVTAADGATLCVPVRLIEGLAGASDADLSTIDITPACLGLHFPKLDADVYVPALFEGTYARKIHGPAAIRTAAEYEQAMAIVNAILDMIGDDETHPLAEPLDMIANQVKAYEDAHVKLSEHLAKLKANKHIGSDFDDFLREEGIYGEVTETAMQRVREWQAKEKGK